MSRIAKRPIKIPEKVSVTANDKSVNVQGPLGNMEIRITDGIKVKATKDQVSVEIVGSTKQAKMNAGTIYRAIQNSVTHVVTPFTKTLEVNGTGYAAKMAGDKLTIALGYSHPVDITIPKDLKVNCPKPNIIEVHGIDRQKVGQFAAFVRSKRPIEPYNLKGIKYSTEVVKKKAGKTAVTGA